MCVLPSCYHYGMPRKFNEEKYKERMGLLHRKEEDNLIEAMAAKYGYQYLDLRGVAINH